MTKDEYRAHLKARVKNIGEMIECFSGAGSATMTSIAILTCEPDRLIEKLYELEREST